VKWLILGALLGLMLACPALGSAAVAVVAALATQPVLVAFTLGLAFRPALRAAQRWAA
jgi:hypothetical protein